MYIWFSKVFPNNSYNRINDENEPEDANNDIYTTSVGYNYSFLDTNLISSKISYTEKHALKNYNAYTGPGLNISFLLKAKKFINIKRMAPSKTAS